MVAVGQPQRPVLALPPPAPDTDWEEEEVVTLIRYRCLGEQFSTINFLVHPGTRMWFVCTIV